MSGYNVKLNKDDSILRHVIAAVLFELNNKLTYTQISENKIEVLKVPFFYAVSGSERFLYDNFMHEIKDDKISGIYDSVPRASIVMESASITSSSIVNKHINIEKNEEENGQIKPYSYEAEILPISLSFSVKMICNSLIEQLKLTESIFTNFYKNSPFYFDGDGYKITGNISLPDELSNENNVEFSYGDKKTHDISFNIDVTTFLPKFNKDSKIFVGNTIGKASVNKHIVK